MPRILLINPNMTVAHTETMVAAAREAAPDAFAVDGLTATEGVPIIADAEGFAAAEAAVARLLDRVAGRVDGVVISAFADPGLEAARARLAVPVVGIAEAAMAATAPDPFAVVTTLPDLDATIRRRAHDYGVAERLVDVRTTPGDGYALMREPARLEAALERLIHDCAAMGARQVVIGGGPLADAARALQARLEVPVVAPIPAAMAALVRQLAGA